MISFLGGEGGKRRQTGDKLKLDPCLSPCTSINSKWIKDPNIRSETLKLVQKRAGILWKQYV
jgi:hypothetical protein